MRSSAYFHGGGWAIGTLDGFDPLCRALANASGAARRAASTTGSRPSTRSRPAPEDARAAVRWLAEQAHELGADPARLAIAGDSAGGNLAAVTARRLRDEGGPPLRFQALIYPVLRQRAQHAVLPRERRRASGSARRAWRATGSSTSTAPTAAQPDASPLQADDLAGLPPAFVLTVDDDVLRDEGEAYARALEAAGVPVTLRRYDGADPRLLPLAGQGGDRRAARSTSVAAALRGGGCA